MGGAKVWKALFVMLVAVSLLTVPGVRAETEASASGQFSIGAVAPQIKQVVFYESDHTTQTTATTPTNAYWIDVQITDLNTMDDIKEITIWLYYGTNSSQLSPIPAGDVNPQTYVILKYERTPFSDREGEWAFYYANGTKIGTTFGTWQIVNQADPASWDQSTGTFSVEIVVGKAAHEANDGKVDGDWNFQVKVIDNEGLQSNTYTGYGYTVNWYGEIWVTETFAFGTVSPNSTNNPLTSPQSGYLDVYVVSNGNFDINVKGDENWTGVNNSSRIITLTTTNPGNKQIRIKINEANDPSTAGAVTTTYTVWLNDQPGPTQDGSAANGNGSHFTAYLWLDVGTNIDQDTYVGHVYFQVTNA